MTSAIPAHSEEFRHLPSSENPRLAAFWEYVYDGNLDERTADHVYGLMLDLNQELRTSLLLVTHDDKLARRCDRIVRLLDGRIDTDGRPA